MDHMGYTEMYSQKLLDFEALLEGQRGTPLPSPSLVHPHGRGQATARAPCRGPGRDQGEQCVAAVHGTLSCACSASQYTPRIIKKKKKYMN